MHSGPRRRGSRRPGWTICFRVGKALTEGVQTDHAPAQLDGFREPPRSGRHLLRQSEVSGLYSGRPDAGAVYGEGYQIDEGGAVKKKAA